MKIAMASAAKSDEIFLAVLTQAAPKQNMVNLQFASSSAILASPVISFQNLATEPSVVISRQSSPGAFRLKTVHADSFRLLMNSSLSGAGRSSTSRRIETDKIVGLA